MNFQQIVNAIKEVMISPPTSNGHYRMYLEEINGMLKAAEYDLKQKYGQDHNYTFIVSQASPQPYNIKVQKERLRIIEEFENKPIWWELSIGKESYKEYLDPTNLIPELITLYNLLALGDKEGILRRNNEYYPLVGAPTTYKWQHWYNDEIIRIDTKKEWLIGVFITRFLLYHKPLTYLQLEVAKKESYAPFLKYLKKYPQVEIKELPSHIKVEIPFYSGRSQKYKEVDLRLLARELSLSPFKR